MIINDDDDDDEYRELQVFLMENPDTGNIIQNTGGIRKIRWLFGNKGKKGGIRIIYYWRVQKDQIYFLTLYAKNEISDLTSQQKRKLKQILEDF
ncbi:MAG: toxin HigB-2 [Gammaproteobacteria bacterium GWE2_37_16]|nr:MAG: toxin HigB-2 [Gammaproteobacteria bacterium GWE2_37_16]